MNFSKKLRASTFWWVDRLRGGEIKNHLEDIEYILNNHPTIETKRLINERLRNILNHAVNSTEFYKNLKGFKTLNDFPVVNKSIIKKQYDSFVSDAFPRSSLNSTTTSGSTGIPFTILRDQNKKKRHLADVLYYEQFAGYQLGMKLYFIRGWNKHTKKSTLTSWFQNIKNISAFDLSGNEIAKIVQQFRDERSDFAILSYASALEAICQYLERKNATPINSKVKCIIAMSEALNQFTRICLNRNLSLSVVSRYSNQDNGIIAQQSINGGEEFYINHASFYLEILDLENDSPVPYGVPGRIVITDFFNYGMPFIRYDTGDIGTMMELQNKNNGLNVLTRIEGRRADMVYNTKDKLVSHFAIGFLLNTYKDINQYQFIQTDQKSYKLILNCEKPHRSEMEIINKLKDCFGHDGIIEIEYVNEIPLLASGKRKRVINKYISYS